MSQARSFHATCSARLASSGLRLRVATDSDLPLIRDIFACTRVDELRQVDWTDSQKRAFTDSQSHAQEHHYALHYGGFERLLVERSDGEPVGRLYVHTAPPLVHLMDITILPQFRRQGIATSLVKEVLHHADLLRLPVELHVEGDNPARRIYEPLGFVGREVQGFYERMERPAVS